jgi:tetratricopeptide (TPR) repeat protein
MDNDKKKAGMPIPDIMLSSPCPNLDQLMEYAEDRLSSRERFRIENHLVDCEFCSEALEGFMISGDRNNIRKDIKALNKEIHRTVTARMTHNPNWLVYYSIAALFLLFFVSIFYFIDRPPSYGHLYAEYFKPYPNTIPTVRGEESAGSLESAMAEYENEQYKESLSILQYLLKSEPANDTASFYAGISSLCLNDPQTAVVYLQTVASNRKSDFIDQAGWYLGLAFLKENNIQAAKICFEKLSSNNGNFKGRSTELLHRLE